MNTITLKIKIRKPCAFSSLLASLSLSFCLSQSVSLSFFERVCVCFLSLISLSVSLYLLLVSFLSVLCVPSVSLSAFLSFVCHSVFCLSVSLSICWSLVSLSFSFPSRCLFRSSFSLHHLSHQMRALRLPSCVALWVLVGVRACVRAV